MVDIWPNRGEIVEEKIVSGVIFCGDIFRINSFCGPPRYRPLFSPLGANGLDRLAGGCFEKRIQVGFDSIDFADIPLYLELYSEQPGPHSRLGTILIKTQKLEKSKTQSK